MFSTAQRLCDLESYENFLAEDFEYFHDKAGFTPSKEAEMADMAIFCGKEQLTRQPLRRALVKNTLEVYPMDNYGALEFCDHLFYLQINDGTEKVIGSGKMTAIWKKEDTGWTVTRIISYDHQPLAEHVVPSSILNRYVGDYVLPDRIVNIKKEGKLLRVTDINDGKAGWTKELFPQSDNKFYLNYENVVYEFLSEGSESTSLIIYENGKVYEEAKRQN
ncbi:MAG: nuclear transport factor 2 family protein [Ekhidna sp.]|nr:nuclear transport factor 2 family protein [Ekhidna sp.]